MDVNRPIARRPKDGHLSEKDRECWVCRGSEIALVISKGIRGQRIVLCLACATRMVHEIEDMAILEMGQHSQGTS